MEQPTTKLQRQFIEGLREEGLTYEEVRDTWKYAGGNRNSHCRYYDLCFPDREPPEWTDRCVCNHEIKENCYIASADESRFLVLGNCCIRKFMKKRTRTCDICGEAHRNRVVNRCNDCRHVKNCKTCGYPSRNLTLGRCDTCRRGVCDLCDAPCNVMYSWCYACHERRRKPAGLLFV